MHEGSKAGVAAGNGHGRRAAALDSAGAAVGNVPEAS